jgi:alkylation response protein AidB-like acyl-CoA dehydrogenase
VQAIRTTAVRRGDGYVINGAKMWITNGRYGNTFVLAAKTDTRTNPPHKGISAFIVEKGGAGFRVERDIDKLGYKGVETCELVFEDFFVPAKNLIGGLEGEGFRHIMTGLESERINVAARGVGLARAAFEDAISYAQQRRTFGKPICEHQTIQNMLADMATKIEAARLLVRSAAEKKDRGERCDLEAGMAKLFATEAAQEIALQALRIHGGNGYAKDFRVERYYRDAPLLIVGGGTNELQRLIIARGLMAKYRAG